MSRRSIWILGALALAGCGDGAPTGRPIAADALVACVNPASGYVWRVKLDGRAGRVNGSPASFGPRQVAWRGADDGGVYQLDPRTGTLAVTRASSTGGYISTYRCHAVDEPGTSGAASP